MRSIRRTAEERGAPPPTPEQRAATEAELALVIARERAAAEAERERCETGRSEAVGVAPAGEGGVGR